MKKLGHAQDWIDGGAYSTLKPHSHRKSSSYHTGPQKNNYRGVKTWDPWKERWWIIQTYP